MTKNRPRPKPATRSPYAKKIGGKLIQYRYITSSRFGKTKLGKI